MPSTANTDSGQGYRPTPAYPSRLRRRGGRRDLGPLLATSPLLDGVGGRYFVDCNKTQTVERRTGTLHGVARYALDPPNAERLWALSEALLADTQGAA